MHDDPGRGLTPAVTAAVVIPALDEAAVIGSVVAGIPRDLVDDVIVVDNGSRDATARVAEAAGARVVTEPRRGYGAACWAGVRALADGTDIAIFLDGDGSQRPEELPRVLEPVRRGEADLVLGTRTLMTGHPVHAALGTRLVAGFIAWRYGVRISDVPPFRAVRVPLLRRLDMRDRAFGWPVEMVVKAAALGARIVEVRVSHEPRLGGRSKVSGTLVGSARAAWGFLRAALRAAEEVR